MSLPFRLKALSSPPPPVLPEGALAAFILWYLSGLDGLSSIASGVFDDLQSLAGWAPGRVRCRGFPRLTLSFCSLCSRSPRSPPTISRSSSAWPPAPCPTGASRVSEAPRPHHLRRWAWPLLIGVLAAAGILLALADISAGGRWPNPLAEALVGPAAVQRHSQSGQNVTLRFDRSRISENFIFGPPFNGLGPLSPYQALRAFLTNGAGLVILALAALVAFPSRARNAVERLEGSHGAEIALGAGLVMVLLTLAAITLLRFTLLFLAVVPLVLLVALVAALFGIACISLAIGRFLHRRLRLPRVHPLVAALAGALVVFDLAVIPYARRICARRGGDGGSRACGGDALWVRGWLGVRRSQLVNH